MWNDQILKFFTLFLEDRNGKAISLFSSNINSLLLRDCAIITWKGGGGRGLQMGEICLKTKSYPSLIKQKLLSTPPHIMMILRLTPPPPSPWKKSPPIDSLIPSLLVGFLPPVQKSLQMTLRRISKSHLKSHKNTGLWACVVFAWIGRFLILYSISGTKVPACPGGNSINQFILASTYLKTFLLYTHFQQLVGKRFYIFYMFFLPYFKFVLLV